MKTLKEMAEKLLKIPKKLFESRLLVKSKERTRIEAVLDLVYLMQEQENLNNIIINGHNFEIKKNQFAVSTRLLAKRWNWQQPRVLDLLNILEKESYIKYIEKTSKGSVLEICF